MGTKANLIIDQGTTFSTSVDILDENGNATDLSNYSGAGQIRKHYTSTNATSFTISITANTGTVQFSLDANTTQSLAAGRYVYDIELTDGAGEVSRVLEGIVTITPSVTR